VASFDPAKLPPPNAANVAQLLGRIKAGLPPAVLKDLYVAVPAGGPYDPGQYYLLSLQAKSAGVANKTVVEDTGALTGSPVGTVKYYSHAATGGI